MSLVDQIVVLLRDVLQVPDSRSLSGESKLLGELPEFDSMAVVNVLVAIEDQFDIAIDDDEVTAEIFESVETLAAFVREQI